MKLEWGSVVAGTESYLGLGTTGALRCTIRVEGRLVVAILKRGEKSEILSEAFCALLLREWGLPVPTPYLVDEPDGIAFASADATYPNLAQRVGLGSFPEDSPQYAKALSLACELICGLASSPLAAAADEAIENRDRNVGNVLWDGINEAWIDHAYSLGNGSHLADANKLCAMSVVANKADDFSRSTISQWLLMDRGYPDQVLKIMGAISPMHAQSSEVCERLAGLGKRLLSRFPAAKDLLSHNE